MLGAALTRLLLDLEAIEGERSAYEAAVISELRALAQADASGGGGVEVERLRPNLRGAITGESFSFSLPRRAGTMRNLSDRFDLSVDLSPTDTIRLSCPSKTCPNKRR